MLAPTGKSRPNGCGLCLPRPHLSPEQALHRLIQLQGLPPRKIDRRLPRSGGDIRAGLRWKMQSSTLPMWTVAIPMKPNAACGKGSPLEPLQRFGKMTRRTLSTVEITGPPYRLEFDQGGLVLLEHSARHPPDLHSSHWPKAFRWRRLLVARSSINIGWPPEPRKWAGQRTANLSGARERSAAIATIRRVAEDAYAKLGPLNLLEAETEIRRRLSNASRRHIRQVLNEPQFCNLRRRAGRPTSK